MSAPGGTKRSGRPVPLPDGFDGADLARSGWYLLALALMVLLFSLPARASVTYQSDPTHRKEIRKAVAADLIASTPGRHRLAVRFLFLGNMMFKEYERVSRSKGYDPYALATAHAFSAVAGWEVWADTELDDSEIGSVVAQSRRWPEHAEEWQRWADRDRQEYAEAVVLKALWLSYLKKLAADVGDGEALAVAKNEAAEFIKELLGVDAGDLGLTADGLVGRERVDPGPPAVEKKADSTQEPPAAASLSPSNGVSQDQVEGIYMRTLTRYGLGGVYVENAAYLMFKDGSLYKEPAVAPADLDVEASKASEPKKWGRWQRRGTSIFVTWSDGDTDEWKTWFVARPAIRGDRLNGGFQSSDPFGGSQVINVNSVFFNREGQFSWENLKGGDTPWLPAYSRKETAGTYVLDGYSIEFRFNGGLAERHTFFFYPKDREHFAIGTSHFVPLD